MTRNYKLQEQHRNNILDKPKKHKIVLGAFGWDMRKVTKYKNGKIKKIEYRKPNHVVLNWREDLPKDQKTWKPKKRGKK